MSRSRRKAEAWSLGAQPLERLLVVAVVLLFVSLPIFFFMSGVGRSFLDGVGDKPKPEREVPELGLGGRANRELEVRSPDRSDLELAMNELDRILQIFDLEVRRIESRRRSGDLDLKAGNSDLLLRILAPATAIFQETLRSKGAPIGFRNESEDLVFDRTPVHFAFEMAFRLPQAIEEAWRNSRGLEDLVARKELDEAIEEARSWVADQ